MKLQKQVAYKYKNKTHQKYVVVIPNDTIKKLGWEVGEELENSVDGSMLMLKPKKRGD
jgi:antitoxin component of MazEF toxin-antitoxin module